MQFDESKHPRDKDGKFTDGSGTGKKAYDSQDKFGNMVRELPQGARDAIDKKIEQLEQEQRIELPKAPVTVVKAKDVTLTKSQWARYYKTLGEIQAGLYNPMKTLDGGNAILIDNMLIFDNGNFIHPRIKSIVVAKNEQYLFDYLEVCRTIGVLKWE